jgi:outer membrane protein
MLKLSALAIAAVMVALLAAPTAYAQDKIGYVNLMLVLEGTAEGKATVARLKSEAEAKEVKFKKRIQTLGEKFKQFQSRAKMMKEEKAAEQAMQLQKEEQELKMMGMQFQAEVQKKQAEALASFQKKVQGVVVVVAKREGVTYVLRQEVLLHGPIKMDLTNQVIREYDKRHKAKKAKKAKKSKKGK